MGRDKIVLLCQYSRGELRKHLHLSKFTIINRIRKACGVTQLSYKDNAPWTKAILSHFGDDSKYEMHVISPHLGMRKCYESFNLNGVCFHFFKSSPLTSIVSILGKVCPKYNIKYRKNERKIQSIVKEIHPKIILLMGVEGLEYSTSVLGIDNIPVFVFTQTLLQDPQFANHFSKEKYQRLVKVEKAIFEKSGYVGIYRDNHYHWLRESGYNKIALKFNWPEANEPIPKPDDSIIKEFDFINFATRMSDEKGYPDSIKALALVKKDFPDVKLNLIDTGSTEEKRKLQQLIEEYNLENNVSFTPFFEDVKDLYLHIQRSRFGVLPCKLDFYSGTMIQCMRYGIPIVVYKTAGTPTLNDSSENILISEMDNIQDLADNMRLLLSNPILANRLRCNSLAYIEKMHMKNMNSMNTIMECINSIIENYYHNKTIPQRLQYD